MQYIKVVNDGALDVPKACNMLGASVKEKENAIGTFGSGLKYALAQACRENIEIFIASGEDIFKVVTKKVEFRGQMFEKVCLKNIHTNNIYETPITTNYGKNDWVQDWSIYREIVCNAMDEDGFLFSIVNGIRRCRNKVAFYLPYDRFCHYYNNHSSYFSNSDNNWIKPGDGIVYKNGVRVGQIEGIKLDFQSSFVQISESRDMCLASARWALGLELRECREQKVWFNLLRSKDLDYIRINIFDSDDGVKKAFENAVRQELGDFAVCPDVPSIISDLKSHNINPFIIPSSWQIDVSTLPSYKDKIGFSNNDEIRKPNKKEKELLNWAREYAEIFDINANYEILIVDSEITKGKFVGLEDKKTIYLLSGLFDDKEALLHTFLHELGHCNSGFGDYDRGFADYFVSRIVKFALQ